ncbi:hypothetical protein [Pseudidiomarina gelatinasegens]|uniref:hypothetical protein n=1 Tax=Pseudidiomarina gelatinasegens TaxID=2487740 RepID=UPI0030EBED3A|tara:strand:- start:1105 stop:1425 length:321 start_codon:yes stop_codon:yes gene_type:complete
MIDFTASDTQAAPVILVRTWPNQDWLQRWLVPNTTLILSEQALLDVVAKPELVEQLPVTPYALHAELKLLDIEELPATIIQLGTARWVEMTLEASSYIVWDETSDV